MPWHNTRRVPWLAVAYAIVIAALTMTSTGGRWVDRTPFCLLCGERVTTDIVLNIGFFVPLGLALARDGWSVRDSLLAGLLLSGAAEFVQGFIPDRSPTIRDILTNTIGAGLGAALAWHLGDWVVRGRRYVTAALLAIGVALGAMAATAALLRPIPTSAEYFGHWRPWPGNLRPWNGTVVAATLDGIELASGRLPASDEVRHALARSEPLVIRAQMGDPGARRASIFAIVDADGRWPLLLSHEGRDLALRLYRRSSRARLETPTQHFRGALSGIADGETLRIVVEGSGSTTPCVVVNTTRYCAPPYRAGSSWTLLLQNRDLGERTGAILDAITVCLLLLPVGLMLPMRRPRATAFVLVVAGAGLALIPWGSGLAPPSIVEWLVSAGAVAFGAMLGNALNGRALHGSPRT